MMIGLVVFIRSVLWESARRDGVHMAISVRSITSTKSFRSGLCTAWPTINRPRVRQLGCSRPRRGGGRQGGNPPGVEHGALTFIDGI